MSIATYADLQNEIAQYLDDETLTDRIQNFIVLAEARHRTEIRMREMLTRSSLTVDARNVDLPTGFLEAINLRLLTDPVTVLEEVSLYEMSNLRVETTGRPYYFTIAQDFEFDKTPDTSYSGQVTYWQAFTALSDTNTSNDLLTTYPDAYLYAALSASAPFQVADERVQMWETLYTQARDRINAQANSSRRVGPLVSRVHGSTP